MKERGRAISWQQRTHNTRQAGRPTARNLLELGEFRDLVHVDRGLCVRRRCCRRETCHEGTHHVPDIFYGAAARLWSVATADLFVCCHPHSSPLIASLEQLRQERFQSSGDDCPLPKQESRVYLVQSRVHETPLSARRLVDERNAPTRSEAIFCQSVSCICAPTEAGAPSSTLGRCQAGEQDVPLAPIPSNVRIALLAPLRSLLCGPAVGLCIYPR